MEPAARESQIVARGLASRRRKIKLRWSVRLGNFLARYLITVGGIGVIVAICLVFIFLISVVAPLFLPATVNPVAPAKNAADSRTAVAVAVDEYQTIGWSLHRDGSLVVFRLDTGATITQKKIVTDAAITSAAVHPLPASGDDQLRHAVVLGLSNGNLQTGRISFTSSYLERADLPARFRTMQTEDVAVLNEGVLQMTPAGQLRHQKVETTFAEPVKISGTAVVRVGCSTPQNEILGEEKTLLLALDEAGVLRRSLISATFNEITGQWRRKVQTAVVSFPARGKQLPVALHVTGRREHGFVVWPGGELQHYDFRRTAPEEQPVETINVLKTTDAVVTSCAMVLGGETLLVGDSAGRLSAWFVVRQADGGWRLQQTHELPQGAAAVTSLGVSQRSRLAMAGYEDGSVAVFHVTTSQRVASLDKALPSRVQQVLIAPKDDGLVAFAGQRIWRSRFDPSHPEATVASLFLPVWYEGYSQPTHRWQATYASAAPEMKLGLLPLIFGTIKATFYTMLFAAPLALMAAIHTSEFMHPALRNTIKPTIELMASLPSVVLGFMAAMIFAPLVELYAPAALAIFVTFPLAYLLAAYGWQLLPQRVVTAVRPYRLVFLLVPLPLAILLALWLGPWIEYLLMAGDMKRWLNGQIGTGAAAWMILWLPLSAFAMTVVVALYVNPSLRPFLNRLSRTTSAFLNLLKFVLATLLVFALAGSAAWFLNDLVGWDPRGAYVGTYEQRNAFVVGMAMGFAVIPVIYTLADDALSTVPQHLRSGSLGCGATPWQTAIRIVIPTAMSGLFSALMVGLGRAAGETMIVLMATGNTPLMETNMFNGMRTLSANIAIELPDAVTGSTHYRTLFLAGLTLFVLTFVLNTIAEIVRTRFRQRAHRL